MGQLQVELRIKAMQPVLIPGPWYVPDKLRTGARDLGSVSTGYSDRPWDPGKQLPLGLSLTGPALRRRVSSAIALELVRRKLQERKKIYE